MCVCVIVSHKKSLHYQHIYTYDMCSKQTCVAGMTLNVGVLLAWSHLRGSLEITAITLYLACTLHTIIYDTIYSHQVHAVRTC